MKIKELQEEIKFQQKKFDEVAERRRQYIEIQDKILEQIQKNIDLLNAKLEECKNSNKAIRKKKHYDFVNMSFYDLKVIARDADSETLEEMYLEIRKSKWSQKRKSRIINVILKNSNVSEWVLRDLGINGSSTNKIAVASNVKTPEDVFTYLYNYEKNHEVNKKMALNISIPKAIRFDMVTDTSNMNYYKELLHNSTVTEEELMIMTRRIVEEKKKNMEDEKYDIYLINVLIHPNISNRIIKFIKENASEKVKAVIENKRLVPIKCCDAFLYTADRDAYWNKIEYIKDALIYSESHLYRLFQDKEKCREFIKWVKSLGFCFPQ